MGPVQVVKPRVQYIWRIILSGAKNPLQSWRNDLLRWLFRKFKCNEGDIMPVALRVMYVLLFPSVLLAHLQTVGPIRYDMMRATFTIHGIVYSYQLFREFGKHGMPEGTLFRLVKRANNTITIERVITQEVR